MLDAGRALIRAEAMVSEVLLASEAAIASLHGVSSGVRTAGAADAIREASRAARAGRRAGARRAGGALLGGLDAIAEAAASRAPIVVHVVGRGGSAARGRDELAPALDAGAGVLVSWSAQDAVDLALGARRAAEDSETPFLHALDAPAALAAPVHLPDRDVCAKFLGPRSAHAAGASDGGPERPDAELEVRRKRAERGFATRVPFALGSALRDLGELTGRGVGPLERHDTQDADVILVAVGATFAPACAAARALRAEGKRIGVLGVRALRPFFGADVVKALSRGRAVVVVEPLDVALAPCGPLAASVKSAFADALTWAPGFPGVGRIPPVVSANFATIDGGVRESDVRAATSEIEAGDRARRVLVFGSDG